MIHVGRVALAGALASSLALCGCPADPPVTTAPPRASSKTSTTPRTPRASTSAPPAGEPAVSDPPPSSSDRSDRARLLAMTPAEVFGGGLRGRNAGELAPLLAGEGALAMAEQLGAAKVPLEALDLCLVVFDRARERSREALVEDAIGAELTRALEVQAGDQPVLRAWVVPLAERVFVQADLGAAVAFLTKVRTIYALSAALTRPR